MSSASYLLSIQQYFTRYGMTTYTTLGNIGLLCNMAVFIWPAYRRNPCSIYILAASLSGLIGLNISTVPVIYSLDHPNPTTTFLIFCQLQFYLRHSFNQMMRTFFIFACVDRYAVSSKHARIRTFSRFQVAICVILCVPTFWLLLSIFPVMLFSIENGRCAGRKGLQAIILSVYIAISVGVVPLLSMVIFGFLMMNNLKTIRSRIQPIVGTSTATHGLRKRDRDMIRMLIIEIICYICATAPLAANLLYASATQTMFKTTERLQIEALINYFTGTFLLYFNNSLAFWIYIAVSRSFRLEFKNIMMKCFTFITGKQLRSNEMN